MTWILTFGHFHDDTVSVPIGRLATIQRHSQPLASDLDPIHLQCPESVLPLVVINVHLAEFLQHTEITHHHPAVSGKCGLQLLLWHSFGNVANEH